MNAPILIGIHGVKRAGKDTTADFIQKRAALFEPALFVVRHGFADKAKLAFARQYFPEITIDQALRWVDDFKEDPSAYFGVPVFGLESNPDVLTVRFRDALAQFCTEGGRDIYGDNFWVDQLLPFDPFDPTNFLTWYRNFDQADICLITDLRFENEVERIKRLGGYVWKIKRKDAEDAVIAEALAKGRDVHRSELGLPDSMFDIVIDNSDNDLKKAEVVTIRKLEQVLST